MNKKACAMCQRPFLKNGKGYVVGKPTNFLICRDCWKGWVIRNTSSLKRVIVGTIDLNTLHP